MCGVREFLIGRPTFAVVMVEIMFIAKCANGMTWTGCKIKDCSLLLRMVSVGVEILPLQAGSELVRPQASLSLDGGRVSL